VSEQNSESDSTVASELELARSFLNGILQRMRVAADVRAAEQEDRLALDVECPDDDGVQVLTGRKGQVIDALQHLVGKMLSRYRGERGKPVVVDAGGYRKRHVERLENLAQRVAEKCKERHEPVRLQPMSPHDRRVIHMALAAITGVRTQSDGEGEDRHVVVFPASE
jgi:spoIIIJ-associated protein